MENSQLLMELFDNKILAILKLFFKNPNNQFYLLEVAKSSGVSSATTFRIVNKLAEIGLINTIRLNKFKLYQLSKNENVEFLQSFIREDIQVLKDFINNIKTIPNIEAIILHGKESTSRANLLIIGENIDNSSMKQLLAAAKEKYGFTISCLTLTKDQYEQMSRMGLYSGQKKILYKI